MKLFKKMKDGGPHSTVTGYWLIEWKAVFSIVLLKFEGKSRETFHTHAFNCISWLISGWDKLQLRLVQMLPPHQLSFNQHSGWDKLLRGLARLLLSHQLSANRHSGWDKLLRDLG